MLTVKSFAWRSHQVYNATRTLFPLDTYMIERMVNPTTKTTEITDLSINWIYHCTLSSMRKVMGIKRYHF